MAPTPLPDTIAIVPPPYDWTHPFLDSHALYWPYGLRAFIAVVAIGLISILGLCILALVFFCLVVPCVESGWRGLRESMDEARVRRMIAGERRRAAREERRREKERRKTTTSRSSPDGEGLELENLPTPPQPIATASSSATARTSGEAPPVYTHFTSTAGYVAPRPAATHGEASPSTTTTTSTTLMPPLPTKPPGRRTAPAYHSNPWAATAPPAYAAAAKTARQSLYGGHHSS